MQPGSDRLPEQFNLVLHDPSRSGSFFRRIDATARIVHDIRRSEPEWSHPRPSRPSGEKIPPGRPQRPSKGVELVLRSPMRPSRAGEWQIAIIAMAIVLTPLAFGPGCVRGDNRGRRPISGTVSLDDAPIDEGMIQFEPAPGEQSGTAVGSLIRRGRFAISKADGPLPGIYRVRVYASSDVQAPSEDGESPTAPQPMVDLIPMRYNKESRLEVEVRARGENHFPFELWSEAAPMAPPRPPVGP